MGFCLWDFCLLGLLSLRGFVFGVFIHGASVRGAFVFGASVRHSAQVSKIHYLIRSFFFNSKNKNEFSQTLWVVGYFICYWISYLKYEIGLLGIAILKKFFFQTAVKYFWKMILIWNLIWQLMATSDPDNDEWYHWYPRYK